MVEEVVVAKEIILERMREMVGPIALPTIMMYMPKEWKEGYTHGTYPTKMVEIVCTATSELIAEGKLGLSSHVNHGYLEYALTLV